MVIAIDIREWRPGRQTGIGRFLEVFLRAAIPASPGHRFLLMGDPDCEIRVPSEGVEVVRIPEGWTPWWDQVRLCRALVRHGADIFYSPYIKVPLLAPMPVASTIHDLTFFVWPEYNQTTRDVASNLLFRAFCRAVVRKAAATLVDSLSTARDVERLLGADPEKLRVVPLATSSAFRPDGDPQVDASARGRYGLVPGYVLYVGRFRPHKNVPRLVRAHAALPDALRTRHPLVLVGEPLPGDLQDLLADPSVSAGVRYIGAVPDAELPSLYRGASLFAFPSQHEGFGLPVLEAMACGVPVLCSTTPAVVEVAADAAHQADPGDAAAWERGLRSLLESPDRRRTLAERGVCRAAEFRPERTAAAILAVLEDAARTPHRMRGRTWER